MVLSLKEGLVECATVYCALKVRSYYCIATLEISLPQPIYSKNLENAKNVEIDEATHVRFQSMIIGKVGCLVFWSSKTFWVVELHWDSK